MKQALSLAALSLLIILSIGMVSADTLVAGIAYNGTMNNPVANASVDIICYFSGSSEMKTTTSSNDGTGIYAVVFDRDCTNVSTSSTDADIMHIYLTVPEDYVIPTSTGGSGTHVGGATFNTEAIKQLLNQNTEETPEETVIPLEEKTQPATNPFTGFITGAVTGIADFAQSGAGLASIIGLVLVATGGVVFFNLRKNPSKKESKE